jgi:hypothetical protein
MNPCINGCAAHRRIIKESEISGTQKTADDEGNPDAAYERARVRGLIGDGSPYRV